MVEVETGGADAWSAPPTRFRELKFDGSWGDQMTVIRTMSRAELGMVLRWAADEGWNPGRCDAIPFHAADPTGFLIMEAADGELAGGTGGGLFRRGLWAP